MKRNTLKSFLCLSMLSLVALLSACGQKGPLYMQENNEMPAVDYQYQQTNVNSSNSNTSSNASSNTPDNTTGNKTENNTLKDSMNDNSKKDTLKETQKDTKK